MLSRDALAQLKLGNSVPFFDNLFLSLLKQQDLQDIIEMLGDPKVNEYLFFAPAPVEVYQDYFNPIIEEIAAAIDAKQWSTKVVIVVRDEQGAFMGMGGLDSVMLHEGNFEVGYQLPQQAWHRGIASSCALLLTQLAFEELGAHKVTADCYAGNVGSYKTLEKVGYRQEGVQQDYYKVADHFEDRLLYGMTVKQWAEYK